MLEISELHLFEVELPKGINVQTQNFLRTLEIEIPSKNNHKKKYNSAHTHHHFSELIEIRILVIRRTRRISFFNMGR